MTRAVSPPTLHLKLVSVAGVLLLPVLWIAVKHVGEISDRYLPGPTQVLRAFSDVEPSILIHTAATFLRLVVGTAAGITAAMMLALLMFRFDVAERLLLPPIQALRSIPPIASIPFFLLWFGFAEVGKFLLVLLGIGLSIAVAAHQLLSQMHPKYRIAFRSFNRRPREFPIRFGLPLLVQGLLPTLRAASAIAFGVVLVSELLGSQAGLGYLIQTSRTTYSIHVIFLVTLILGALTVAFDYALVRLFRRLAFWTKP